LLIPLLLPVTIAIVPAKRFTAQPRLPP